MKPGWKLLIERFPHARLLWDAPGPVMARVGAPSELRAYSVNGCVVIVHDYGIGVGWNIYTPTTDSGEIQETLDAVDSRTRGIDYDYRGN